MSLSVRSIMANRLSFQSKSKKIKEDKEEKNFVKSDIPYDRPENKVEKYEYSRPDSVVMLQPIIIPYPVKPNDSDKDMGGAYYL